MSLKNIFSSLLPLFQTSKKRSRRNGSIGHSPVPYNRLEPKYLLANIIFDDATGNLTLAGDGNDNVAAVSLVNGNQVRATMSGVPSETFSVADVQQITFIGFDGNDQFTNNSSIASFQYGGDGNDQLTGGTADDLINGGRGNDVIRGLDGNDRLIGNLGNDEVRGGNGNDRINGTAGVNEIFGGNDDDIIFGGDQVDTISGGAGIDQIYALGGNDVIDAGAGGVIGSPGVEQADLVLGLAGNDTITAGAGLNVLYGGDGNDTITGANSAENRLHGQNGRDRLTGGNLGDYLSGGADIDNLMGAGGSDFLFSGLGDDRVDGGAGQDFQIFLGNDRQYRINGTSTLSVRDMRDVGGNEGTDTATTVERFRFGNLTQPAVSPIAERLNVRPVVVANSNGTNQADFFGTADQEAEIKRYIDDIYYQANIDVVWTAERDWNNTFANVGNGGTRPQSDLTRIVTDGDAAGVGSTNSLVLDAYFVQISAGFGQTSDDVANGLAYIDANGSTMHIGSNLLEFDAGRRVIAQVVAHELAHNLGLNHINASGNLMDRGTNLNASQIRTIQESRFSIPISG